MGAFLLDCALMAYCRRLAHALLGLLDVQWRRWFTAQSYPSRLPSPPFLHSSWNRTPSLGYRIVNLQLADDGRTITDHSVFADGCAVQLMSWLWRD